MQIGLNEKERSELCQFLDILLASTYALYLKTQNYHWNVKGSDFFAYHLMFEKQYEELAEVIDEIAERIRALGETSIGSFESFLKNSLVKGEIGKPSAKEMIKRLLKDHEILIKYLREHLPYSEKVHDGATADLINKRLASHEKVAWMLRSHI